MNCGHIRELLSPYLEKIVPAREEELISSHLSQCHACREILAEMKKTQALLSKLKDIETPPWMAQRIMAEVRKSQQAEGKANFWKSFFYPYHIKVPVQGLVMVLVMLLIVQVYRSIEPSKITAPQSMESLEMTPEDINRHKAREAASSIVSSPGKTALSGKGKPAAAIPEQTISPKQSSTATDSNLLKKDAAPVRQEVVRTDNEIAQPYPQVAPRLEKKRAPAAAAKEESQPIESMLAAAHNEDSKALKAEEEGINQKSKKQSADKALIGAAMVPAAVQLTLRTSAPAAAAAEIEAYLNRVRQKSFTKEMRNYEIYFTATLSSEEADLLVKKLGDMGSVSPGSYQFPRGKTTIRLYILQGH